MKGYISNYNKSDSNNSFEEDIFLALYKNILESCFGLIENGYKSYVDDTVKVFSPEETQITAGIYDHICKIIIADKLNFDIVPEYFIYSEDIRKGKKNPKKAKRFDLRILAWKNNNKFKFGIEAKLLAEKNYEKKVASTLVKEYVEDAGMGKFLKNFYDPNSYNEGCMIGHILNGELNTIVSKINDKISKTYSIKECLSKHENHYISNYEDGSTRKNLYHLFLNFSMLAN